MQRTRGPRVITFEMLPPRSPTHGHTCLGMLLRTMRMCSRQTEAPTILMHWRHFLRNAAEIPSKPNSNSQNGTHHGLALTTMRHTLWAPDIREKRKTYQETVTSRHDAEHAMISNATQTVVLRNFSALRHTEKRDGKPHRGTKTMSAQVGETWSHASTDETPVQVANCRQLPITQRKTKHASQQPHSPRSCLRSCTTATHITKEHVSHAQPTLTVTTCYALPCHRTHKHHLSTTPQTTPVPCRLLRHWHRNAATR